MIHFNLIHSEHIFPISNNKQFYISSDCNKLTNNINTIGLSNLPKNNKLYDLYSYDIIQYHKQDLCFLSVVVIINLKILIQLISFGYDIPSRNTLFKSIRRHNKLKQCKLLIKYKKLSISDICNINISDISYQNQLIQWIINNEKNNNYLKQLEYLNKNIIQLSNNIFIDIVLERFYINQNQLSNFFFGGIINIEPSCGKKYSLIHLIKNNNNNNKKQYVNKFKYNSSATIIFTDTYNKWKTQINKWYPDCSLIIIHNKYQFEKYTYNNLINSDIVIFSYNFLINDCFRKLIDVYQQNNQNLIQALNTLNCEYLRKTDLLNSNYPLFFLINWNRLIIDNFNYIDKLIESDYINIILKHTNSYYKWVTCNYKSLDSIITLSMINILSSSDVNQNIFLNHNLYNNILQVQYDDIKHCLYNSNRKIQFVNIPLLDKEKKSINNLQINSSCSTCINYKYIHINKLHTFITDNNYTKKLDITHIDKCPICISKIDKNNMGITKCGHIFCYTCVYKESKCPHCRVLLSENSVRNILFDDIFNHNDIFIRNRYGSKVDYFLRNINFYCKTLICSQVNLTCNILSNLFEFMGYKTNYKNTNNIDISFIFLKINELINNINFEYIDTVIIWDIDIGSFLYNQLESFFQYNLRFFNKNKKINIYYYNDI